MELIILSINEVVNISKLYFFNSFWYSKFKYHYQNNTSN